MKHRLIMSLDGITDSDQPIVGAKAVGLWRLKRMGLPVPDAFCVAANAYETHINTLSLKAVIDDTRILSGKPEGFDIAGNLDVIRGTIVDSKMNDSLVAEIESHYNTLVADRLAIRSSATAEDLPGYSFAGLYDTYLGISNLEDCLIAIKKCWASLWTERAYSYRQKNGFDHSKVEMAVIVQSLIPADVAGVIFTADPITGDDNRIIIEACLGLGDALVSGKVSPDRVVLDKKGPNVISRSMVAPCINDPTAQKLAKLAIKAESEFGCPQDIEWAIHQGKIFLLQSRPITTKPKAKSWEDRQIWCSYAAREVLPDVVTPATSSAFRFFEETLSKTIIDVLCIDKINVPTFDIVAGRIYFNISLFAAIARYFKRANKLDWREFAGSDPELIGMFEKLKDTQTEDLPEVRHNRLKFILKLPLLTANVLFNSRHKSEAFLAKAKTINEKWACLEYAGLSDEQLGNCLMEAISDLHKIIVTASGFLRMVYWMEFFPMLDIVCKRWIPQEQSCAGRLLAGLGNMTDAEAGLELWELAEKINNNAILKKLAQSDEKWEVVRKEMGKIPAGEEFLAEWERFMRIHGHHCRGEIELYNKRWSETPDYILGILRGYINSIGDTNLRENRVRIVEQREQLEKKCRRELKNPFKQAVFNYLLSRSRYGSVFRENIKSEVVKILASVRKIMFEAGRRAASASWIADGEDVFFLELKEIGDLSRGHLREDIKKVIADRRTEYEKWKSITPPSVIFGRFNPDSYKPEEVKEGEEILKGMAVSPGVVRGKARVILRADDNEQVQAGEILVAPFTDPGWTPYFIPAAGIVMDQGGLLSHGAIIAREYGIPAVVNVGNATKIIKTGQTIQVDGDRGVVRILE